jgi:hypothetical protein
VASRYHLVVGGVLPAITANQLRCRFGDVTVASTSGQTVIDGIVADQASLRSLLALLWDIGSDVLELESSPIPETA